MDPFSLSKSAISITEVQSGSFLTRSMSSVSFSFDLGLREDARLRLTSLEPKFIPTLNPGGTVLSSKYANYKITEFFVCELSVICIAVDLF